LNLLQK